MTRTCARCQADIGPDERATPLTDGNIVCPACTTVLMRDMIERMGQGVNLPLATTTYAMGAGIGAAIYAGSVAWSGWDVALVAIAIPMIGLKLMDRLQGPKRGLDLQAMAVTVSLLMFAFSRVLTAWIVVNNQAEAAGQATLSLLQLPGLWWPLLTAAVDWLDLLWIGLVTVTAWRGCALPTLPGDKPPEASRTAKALARWGAPGAALLWFLGKGKWLLAGAKFLKLGTVGTMLLSIVVYAQFFGWPYAVGFVLLIFVHEMGHAIAMTRMGLPFSAPVFIPFLGAWIAMKDMPRNSWVEAVVGIGGPLLGTIGAIACLGLALATGSELMYAIAAAGFFLNLFNMVPISPLDGGRIVGVFGRWLWGVGYLVGGVLFVVLRSPILLLILLMGLANLKRILNPPPGYNDVESWKRWTMGFSYGGLIAVMILGLAISSAPIAHLIEQDTVAVLLLPGLLQLLTRKS